MNDTYELILEGQQNSTSFGSQFDLNNFLANSTIKPRVVIMSVGETKVKVDCHLGKIWVKPKEKDSFDELEAGFSFYSDLFGLINFNRKSLSVGGDSTKEDTVFVLGLTDYRFNDERMVAVKEDGSWELWKKR